MVLHNVLIRNFRNFNEQTYEFHPALTIIIGENARGKTNLLEAVFLSVNGVGFRETKEDELLQWEKEMALIETTWRENNESTVFQILLQKLGEE